MFGAHEGKRGVRCWVGIVLLGAMPLAGEVGFLEIARGAAGAKSFTMALGDVDGDGDLDAVVGDYFGPVVLYLNDGDGRFSERRVLYAGGATALALGALDAGSSLDLWVGDGDGDTILWNDGNGHFTDGGLSIGASVQQDGVSLGDLDGDGDLDACIPYNGDTTNAEVFRNDGGGSFTSAQTFPGDFGKAAGFGDVDDDGDIDILLAKNGANRLWLNNGAAVFTDSGQSVGSHDSFDVALGDVDGDGDLDAWFANGGLNEGNDELWLNNGSGVFSNSGQGLDALYSFAVELADFDGDGDLDAVVGNSDTQPNRLFTNDGAGHFTLSAQSIGSGGVLDLAVGDLDGDADLDLFLANHHQPDQVFLNDGAGHFSDSGQLLGGFSGLAIAAGDFDGDGATDMVVGGIGGYSRLLLNRGNGTFFDSGQWISSGFHIDVNAVNVADIDDDGDLDLLFALTDDTGTALVGSRFFRNNGSGVFTPSATLSAARTFDVALGDLDGDGDPDAVTANVPYLGDPGTNKLFLNDGTGAYVASAEVLGTGDHRVVRMVDIDGDGDRDLIFGRGTGGATLFRNDGAGHFTDTGQVLGTWPVDAIAIGDVDGDGDRDLALAGSSDAARIWRNDGSGTFTDSGQWILGSGIRGLHLFDIDGDGDRDLWLTVGGGLGGVFGQPNRVYWNDGTGLFSDSGWALGEASSLESTPADIDGDGDIDILTASESGEHEVFMNRLSGAFFRDGFELGDFTNWSSTSP